jgi:hypothetical protein
VPAVGAFIIFIIFIIFAVAFRPAADTTTRVTA